MQREYQRSALHDGDAATTPLNYRLTCEGQRVDIIEKGRYRRRDGLELTTDDPNAPSNAD